LLRSLRRPRPLGTAWHRLHPGRVPPLAVSPLRLRPDEPGAGKTALEIADLDRHARMVAPAPHPSTAVEPVAAATRATLPMSVRSASFADVRDPTEVDPPALVPRPKPFLVARGKLLRRFWLRHPLRGCALDPPYARRRHARVREQARGCSRRVASGRG